MQTENNSHLRESFAASAVEFKLNAALHEDYCDVDFIHSICGRILTGSEEGECTVEAGYIQATLVQFGEALDHNIDALRLGDGISGEVAEYWEALCEGDYGWKEKIQEQFHADPGNLLIIESVEVYPTFRGRQLGIASAHRLIDIFGGGCGLVGCRPFPPQFLPSFKNDPAMLERLNVPPLREDAAKRKLQTYWYKAGFRPLGNTGIYLISMACRWQHMRSPSPMITDRAYLVPSKTESDST